MVMIVEYCLMIIHICCCIRTLLWIRHDIRVFLLYLIILPNPLLHNIVPIQNNAKQADVNISSINPQVQRHASTQLYKKESSLIGTVMYLPPTLLVLEPISPIQAPRIVMNTINLLCFPSKCTSPHTHHATLLNIFGSVVHHLEEV
jgi:hypothetical protein